MRHYAAFRLWCCPRGDDTPVLLIEHVQSGERAALPSVAAVACWMRDRPPLSDRAAPREAVVRGGVPGVAADLPCGRGE